MNNPLDFRPESLCLLKESQEDYWCYRRKDLHDFSVYTEKSAIYEPPAKEKFRESSDVLVRWTDGLLYLATIIQVEDEYNRCAVKFEDGSQFWALYKDIYKGPLPEGEESCTVCDSGSSQPPDEIVICDKCSVGYHQSCHIPKIDSIVLKPEISWSCRKCIFAAAAKKGGALKKGHNAQLMMVMKRTLPYNAQALTWDSSHRSNLQQTYCYCGGPGEWYSKMLQCSRCKQWFHEACIQCLEEPLLYGDRFYIFICSVCNKGPEFLRRLPLRWPDIAHLVLFNLTVTIGKKYFEFDTTIMTFLKDNWSQFLIKGEPVSRVLTDEKKKKMLEILKSCKSRFCSGKEIKKKTYVWGLRSRVPPPVPVISVPQNGSITNDVFDSFLAASRKSKPSTKPTSIVMPIKRARKSSVLDNASSIAKDGFDSKLQEREKNITCKTSVPDDNNKINANVFDSKSLKSGENFVKGKLSVKPNALNNANRSPTASYGFESKSQRVRDSLITEKTANIATVKASSPVKGKVASLVTEKTASPIKPKKKVKRKLPVRMARFRKPDSIRKYNSSAIPVIDLSDSEDTISSQGTLNSIIPHPTDFEGSNNPFLNNYKLHSDNITASSDSSNVSLRCSSPTRSTTSSNSDAKSTITGSSHSSSTSKNIGPNTPKMTTTITNFSKSIVPDITKNASSSVSPKSIVQSAIQSNISSKRSCLKSTLKNITRTSSKKSSATSTSASNILKNVIKNNQRLRSRARLQRTCTTVKTGSVIDTLLNDSSPPSGFISDKSIPSSTPSCIDLNSSVSNYFGAAERIANGEKFKVRGLRITSEGKLQYLMEWDNVTSS